MWFDIMTLVKIYTGEPKTKLPHDFRSATLNMKLNIMYFNVHKICFVCLMVTTTCGFGVFEQIIPDFVFMGKLFLQTKLYPEASDEIQPNKHRTKKKLNV